MKTVLLSLSDAELAKLIAELSLPSYRAGQIKRRLLAGDDISEMTELSKRLRDALCDVAETGLPKIARKLTSSDGTVKYLFALRDGQLIESVVMRYRHGRTICVSTEAGCAMGCKFCASNTGGLVRPLESYEMLGQVIAAQRDIGERIDGIVMMGIGEPLDNYANSIDFIRRVSSPDGLNIGQRHISLSTCGLADKIRLLADEDLQITLSVSLHAVADDERNAIMPVNRRFNIDELLKAVKYYFDKTGRRPSFEYALLAGVNDDETHAAALAALIGRYFGREPFHVNLIPVNEVKGRGFKRPKSAETFARALAARHVNATVRRSLGGDIDAACGQLRAETRDSTEF